MNVLGASLAGDVIGYLGGGSLASDSYGVDNDGGANPVNWECSPIGANGDQGNTCQGMLKGVASIGGPSIWRRSGLWWTGDTFTKEGVVRLIPPHLDCRRGGPGVVPTGPVEHVQGLGMAGMCGGSSHGNPIHL